jgi:hypothetical protein
MKDNPGSQVAEKPANRPSPWPMPGRTTCSTIGSMRGALLLLDVVRQRGNNRIEHNTCKAPNVLSFEGELVLDGRSLPRPVNYGLVRIVPPYFSLTTMTTTGYGDIVPLDPFAPSVGVCY